MHASSQSRVAEFVAAHLADRRGVPTAVLEVGSHDLNGSYRALFDDPAWTYTGMDVESGPGVDVVVTHPYRWSELKSRSFDVVISGQVLEHVEFPWVTMLEVTRVLRPGGIACIVAPSSGPEHRHPVDCWRFYRDGFEALASWADLDTVEATTYWEDRDWPDDSALWQDSVLVARRRITGRARGAFAATKRRVMHRALVGQARRRSLQGRASAAERSKSSV